MKTSSLHQIQIKSSGKNKIDPKVVVYLIEEQEFRKTHNPGKLIKLLGATPQLLTFHKNKNKEVINNG